MFDAEGGEQSDNTLDLIAGEPRLRCFKPAMRLRQAVKTEEITSVRDRETQVLNLSVE
jgi:hypothetical protein